jgi:hypothetical protein
LTHRLSLVSNVDTTTVDGGVVQVKRWSRVDQVLLEAVLWVLPAAVLVSVLLDVLRALRGRPLEVTGVLPDDVVRSTDLLTGPFTGTVVVDDPSATQYGWDFVPSVVLLVLAVVVARLLLGVVRSLRLGDPFTAANAKRLATLSVVVIVGGVFLPFVQQIALDGVLTPMLAEGPRTWTLDLALWPALTGVLVGFLAEVFARGTRLRGDVEGLV